jgi:hypothetical protein
MRRRDFLRSLGAVSLFSPSAFAGALKVGNRGKTLVLGGGAFAMGYALAHPHETVVIERGIHLCADFALTFEDYSVGEASTPLGRALAEGLRGAGILKGDSLECPPLPDYLSVFFSERGGRAFMNAELADVRRTASGWEVEIYGGGSDGLHSFEVTDIIDTTPAGWRNAGLDAVSGKRISVQTDKGVFSVDLPPDADWRASRLALYDAWERSGRKDRILAEAGALKYLYRTKRTERMSPEGFHWIASAQFPTLIAAFEEGLKWTLP